MAALCALGLRCVMLTGDNWATARAIAAQAGVEQVIAEVLPAGKAEEIRRMQVGVDFGGVGVGWVGGGG